MSYDLACDVALEDARDLGLGTPFIETPGDVGAGARVAAHAGEHDAPQRMVGLTVPAPVEPVAGDLARRRRDGSDATQVRPGRLGADALGVIARGHEQDGGG